MLIYALKMSNRKSQKSNFKQANYVLMSIHKYFVCTWMFSNITIQ